MRQIKLDCQPWTKNSMAYTVRYFDVKKAYRANGISYTIDAFIYELDQCKTQANMAITELITWKLPQETLAECDEIMKRMQK